MQDVRLGAVECRLTYSLAEAASPLFPSPTSLAGRGGLVKHGKALNSNMVSEVRGGTIHASRQNGTSCAPQPPLHTRQLALPRWRSYTARAAPGKNAGTRHKEASQIDTGGARRPSLSPAQPPVGAPSQVVPPGGPQQSRSTIPWQPLASAPHHVTSRTAPVVLKSPAEATRHGAREERTPRSGC